MSNDKLIDNALQLYRNRVIIPFYQILEQGSALSLYASLTEQMMDEKYEQMKVNLSKGTLNETEDQTHRLLIEALEGEYRHYTYSSMFLMAYANFENNLDLICKHMHQMFPYPVKLKDLHGSGIERAKNYLTKIVGFELPSEQWGRIFGNFNKIRNVLAHKNGVIDVDNSSQVNEISMAMKTIGNISLDDDGRLMLQVEFCTKFIEDCNVLYTHLLKEVEDYLDEEKFRKKHGISISKANGDIVVRIVHL